MVGAVTGGTGAVVIPGMVGAVTGGTGATVIPAMMTAMTAVAAPILLIKALLLKGFLVGQILQRLNKKPSKSYGQHGGYESGYGGYGRSYNEGDRTKNYRNPYQHDDGNNYVDDTSYYGRH